VRNKRRCQRLTHCLRKAYAVAQQNLFYWNFVIHTGTRCRGSAQYGRKARFRLTAAVRSALLLVCFTNVCASQALPFANDGNIRMPESSSSAAAPQLRETITVNTPAPAQADLISDLIESASSRDSQVHECLETINKFNSKTLNVKAKANDAINWIFLTKGISSSSEAGDVILDEKRKMTGLGAAKLLKEKVLDDLELQVVTSTLQLASTLGAPAANKLEQEKAARQLEDLVGKEAADGAKMILANQARHDFTVPCNDIWNVTQLQHRVQAATQAAALNDRIVGEIRADLHKYNTHSGAGLVSQKLVRTSLCIASLSPSLVGPAAQALLFGYVLLSGGSEEAKIMHELYMDKRLECRANLLGEEAHLAFDNFRMGVMTNNRVLASVSEQLLQKLTSPALAHDLLTAAICPAIDDRAAEQVVYQAGANASGHNALVSVDHMQESSPEDADSQMRFVIDVGPH